jgi:hypothetical protein
VAIKNVVIPWISGGAVLLGYAAFAWFRQRERSATSRAGLSHPEYEVPLLSDRLEHVPEAMALDAESDPALPADGNAPARHAGLGALFLGRATSALSPFDNDPQRSSTGAGKF